jgi:hypothetical protein
MLKYNKMRHLLIEESLYMKIYAKFLNKHGYDHEPVNAVKDGLVEGNMYEVEHCSVGSWNSSIFLKNFSCGYNSVMFDCFDENGNEVDIIAKYRYTYDERYM